MSDPFASNTLVPGGMATRHVTITPDDDNDLPEIPRGLYCEGAGTVAIVDEAGTEKSYTLTQGQVLTFRPVRVKASGTTATVYGWI